LSKIKVLHYRTEWLGLTETWLHNQVVSLPGDIESSVICEKTANVDLFPVPGLHALDNERWYRSFWDRGLRRLGIRRHLGFLAATLGQIKPNIVHSHFGNTAWSNCAVLARSGIPHVVTFYGLDVNYLPTVSPCWRDRYHELFSKVDRVLCEGDHMATCIAELGCPEEKVQVHHLGVRIEGIPFVPRHWQPGEPLRVLMAAAFREKKGIPYGLEALARLKKEIPLTITIIGDANREQRSLEEKRNILAAIDRCGLAENIRLLGYQPYPVLWAEAASHHLYLAPSVTASDGDTEGGAPVTLIEMAASGMPIVSTRHCDIPEVLPSGFLAEERDVAGLEREIGRLLEQPEDLRERLVAARRHVEKEYNAIVQGNRLAAIYRKVVGGEGRAA